MTATNPAPHVLAAGGVLIARTPTGIAVNTQIGADPLGPLAVEVWYNGVWIKTSTIDEVPWRDYLGSKVDHLRLVIRVRDGLGALLAELSLPDEEYPLPFMVAQGEQQHITENYVSVPPALTITDEVGATWTLGFVAAPKEKSPEGEFAFPVLRDGVDTHEIASRIERRGGKVRILTRHGWKKWNGAAFF